LGKGTQGDSKGKSEGGATRSGYVYQMYPKRVNDLSESSVTEFAGTFEKQIPSPTKVGS